MTSTAAAPPVTTGELQPTSLEKFAMTALTFLPSRKLMLRTIAELATDMLAKAPNTEVFNMSGAPAISLPISMNSGGLPIGVQFTARYGNEETILHLAQQLEQAVGWHQRRPPLIS